METKANKSIKNSTDFDYRVIKTFEDACKKLKLFPSVPLVSIVPERFRKRIIAAYKLMVIYEAINNGWIPDWSNNRQWKFYPILEVLPSGTGFLYSYYSSCLNRTSISSCLCTDTCDKALFIAEHFQSECLDYYFFPKESPVSEYMREFIRHP